MSRNISGVFTLPAGVNPVVAGTVITDTWANTTMNDIAAALTDSLSRSGSGAMTAALRVTDGTVSAPGLTFSLEATSGIYRAGAGDVRFSILNGDSLIITTAGAFAPAPTFGANSAQLINAAYAQAYYAPIGSPTFTGTVTLPAATSIGPVSAAEIGYLDGVTSALQTQLDAKAPLNDAALTGVPTAPTAAPGTNTTQLATTAFVAAQAFSASLPNQAGNAGKFVTTNGTVASWADPLPSQTGNAGKFLQTNGTTPSWVSATAGDHEVRVKTGNGLGSTNTYVRRFTTQVRNVGTAITYADSAAAGASFTINETGLYSVYYSDALSAGSGGCCIGINTSPTASANTLILTTPSSLAGDFLYTNVGVTTFSSRVVRLTAGDVLRPYNQFTTNGFSDTNFIIRKVGV